VKSDWKLKPNFITLPGSKLVADGFKLDQLLRPASNQLRTCFEPDSVMEFGHEPANSC